MVVVIQDERDPLRHEMPPELSQPTQHAISADMVGSRCMTASPAVSAELVDLGACQLPANVA